MTFDPDRRRDLDPDPVRRRMAEGESVGWIPGVLGILLLAGFAYMIFAGWNSEPRTTRESNVRIERPAVTPPPVPKSPN
jgi:hypothetical protein